MKLTLYSAKVWRENEMFILMYWRSPQTADFYHFTLLFCRGQYRNVPTCKTHVQSVQSDCFCSLNRLFCGVLVAVAVVLA